MPFPLIPLLLGAAAGAAVTYLLKDKVSKRAGEAADGLSQKAVADVKESGSAGHEAVEASQERGTPEADR